MTHTHCGTVLEIRRERIMDDPVLDEMVPWCQRCARVIRDPQELSA
jgi:hypothetical protein